MDPAHSAASFSLKHMLVATVRGQMAGLDLDMEAVQAAPPVVSGPVAAGA